MSGSVHIIDYGMGNLRSVQKAFERVGVSAHICQRPSEARGATHLVLPGVGAFRDAISELRQGDFVSLVCDHIAADLPFLGICLGLQLLFDVSYEDGEHPGLGVLAGEVVRFPPAPGLKIPHMGWNTLDVVRPNPLLAGLPERPSMYFVHSYFVVPRDPGVVAAVAEHGQRFVAAAARGMLFATQFHPEKSQSLGLHLLGQFAKLRATHLAPEITGGR